MTEPAELVTRISVSYVKLGPGGERETHIIGLTSERNKKHIKPWHLYEMLRMVAVCCEDVLAQRLISASDKSSAGLSGSHEDDGQRTVTTTESDSASQQ
jgi:hypothetical protein